MKKLPIISVISLFCSLPALPSYAQELNLYPAGTMAGGAKQRSEAKAQEQAQQQKQAATKDSLDKFKRAYSACLEGKGYTVK